VLGLSHTSLAPMTSIKALADEMFESVSDVTHRHYLEVISAESQRAADTLRRMLYVAKLSGGDLMAVPQNVDICKLVRESVMSYCVLLDADDVHTSVQCFAKPLRLRVDPVLMSCAFSEIAANARQAVQMSQAPPGQDYFLVRCELDESAQKC